MANEAVCIENPTKFARYTIAASAIPKYSLLQISSDPNTATISSGDGDVFGGIAMEETTVLGGMTQISAALDGVWDLKASTDAVTLGAMCVISGVNLIRPAVAADLLTGATFCKALETGDASEVIRVRLGLN